MLSSEAAQLLREENDLLQAQLELISEKMYGSPAKSAARERDRLAAELDRERSARLTAEDACGELDEELQKAHGRIRELEARLHAEGSMRADLERTRRALHAAQTNAALGLMRGADSQGESRACPTRSPRRATSLAASRGGERTRRRRAAARAARHERRGDGGACA